MVPFDANSARSHPAAAQRAARRVWVLRGLTLALVLAGGGLGWLSWHTPRTPVREPAAVEAGGVAAIPFASGPVGNAFAPPVVPSSGVAPGANLYGLPGPWRNAAGEQVSLAAFRGRPALFTFVYTRCDDLCPIVVGALRDALAHLPESERARARHLLIAIDPAHDTPEAMRAYRRDLGLDPARWELLTAPEPVLRLLATLVDFQYRPVGDRFVHNVVVAVANESGEITARFSEGLSRPRWLGQGIARALQQQR